MRFHLWNLGLISSFCLVEFEIERNRNRKVYPQNVSNLSTKFDFKHLRKFNSFFIALHRPVSLRISFVHVTCYERIENRY